MRASLLSVLLAGGAALWLWSRATGGETAVAISSADDPLNAVSDLADQAVADVIGWSIPSRGAQYAPAIDAAEIQYGIPHNLLARLLYQESRYRPEIINGTVPSPAGALGIAQFEPATAASLGFDPLDVNASIDGAGKYLSQLYAQFGSWSLALAAYNDGPGNIKKHGLDGAPQETQDYVAEITADVPVA